MNRMTVLCRQALHSAHRMDVFAWNSWRHSFMSDL
jgi:hypothetical protein